MAANTTRNTLYFIAHLPLSPRSHKNSLRKCQQMGVGRIFLSLPITILEIIRKEAGFQCLKETQVERGHSTLR
jgi:hypothetical protein